MVIKAFGRGPGHLSRMTTAKASPAPSWTVDPHIAPTSGNVGDTFSGSDGTIIDGTVTARAWLLDGVIIPGEESSTITTTAAGSLVFRVTATGSGGTTTQDSAPVMIVQPVPVNTVLPTISGTEQVGEVLSSTTGTWTNSPTSYAYQWQRDGTNISGATGTTYILVEADEGANIRVSVTATNAGGAGAPAVSAATGPITPALAAPVNTALPTITGTAQVGETLTSTTGTWTGNPTPTYARQWKADGANIAGATAPTYVPVVGDVGKAITVTVTAANSVGNANATSAATAAVVDAPATSPFAPFTVTAGTGDDGDTGYYTTIYGSISDEPLIGFPLLEFSTRNANYTQVSFTGDCLATVTGWLPVITGVTLGAVISDWAFDGTDTTGTWESTGVMVEASEYPITWVEG